MPLLGLVLVAGSGGELCSWLFSRAVRSLGNSKHQEGVDVVREDGGQVRVGRRGLVILWAVRPSCLRFFSGRGIQ